MNMNISPRLISIIQLRIHDLLCQLYCSKRYTWIMMVSGNTVLIQLCMFESETDSEEVEEWIIQARLQVDVSEW